MSNKSKKYKTAEAFKQALISNLQNISKKENKSIEAVIYKVIFERFLARVFNNKSDKLIVKGAYSLELHYKDTNISRTTKDIDFVLKQLKHTSENEIWDLLKEISKIDLKDWFSFDVLAPQKELTLPTYGGWRFPIIAKIGDKEFKRFNIDIVLADSLTLVPEWILGNDFLDFAKIDPPLIAAIPIAKQFAEKIHTYTNPMIENNSRVKDLVDLIIHIDQAKLPKSKILKAEIANTFKLRRTHDIPRVLLSPPKDWEILYKNLASEWNASKKTIKEAFEYLSNFWNNLYH